MKIIRTQAVYDSFSRADISFLKKSLISTNQR